jgi:N-methylhydantoinase A
MPRVVGVDVGGTFTDVVVFDGHAITGHKVPTTAEQADGVVAALDWAEDDLLMHGTTAATNALLEERGGVVALVTDSGYEDIIEIARQDRPSLYDSSVDRPVALVPRRRRIGHAGDIEETLGRLAEVSPDIVVVGLIESYKDPDREGEIARAIRRRLQLPVVAASTVSPEFREYERIATGVVSAYLTPSVGGYLEELGQRLPVARGLVMTSSGGLLPFPQAADSAAALVLSGPAGGVVAAAALAAHHGHGQAISFDMGGTSTDVCRIVGGVPQVTSGHRVAGRVVRVPSVPVRTIGAGGGSIGWVDAGGALRVGPRSAGANPGPASYGMGGSEPTVTDANLALGHLPPEVALAGSMVLDQDAARRALEALGRACGLDGEGTARGMLEIVDSHMEHALRAVSVEEGADPREAVLVAFGGAGGLHAGRLARRLQIPRVLIPPFAGVFSALGLLLASPRADVARTVMLPDGDTSLVGLARKGEAEAAARFVGLFGVEPRGVNLGFDCRYAGQSHELEVETVPDWAAVRSEFEDAHRRHFGFTRPGEPIEVVTVRSWALGEPPLVWDRIVPRLPTRRPTAVGGVWRRDALPAGTQISGPALVVEDTAVVLVDPGDRLTVLDDGTVELELA